MLNESVVVDPGGRRPPSRLDKGASDSPFGDGDGSAGRCCERAPVWDEFNGPDHTEDPVEKGYIDADGFHPSEQGAQVIADLLHELG